MATDAFATWPTEHYETAAERNEREWLEASSHSSYWFSARPCPVCGAPLGDEGCPVELGHDYDD